LKHAAKGGLKAIPEAILDSSKANLREEDSADDVSIIVVVVCAGGATTVKDWPELLRGFLDVAKIIDEISG
jgi:hypothetical protein